MGIRGHRRAGAAPPYRGKDRRGTPAVHDSSLGPFIIAGVGLMVALVFFSVGPLLSEAIGVVDAALLRLQFDAAAVAVAVLAGVLCVIRWRITGEAAALWLGTALVFLGIATIGLDSVLARPGAPGEAAEILMWVQPASRVTVIWLLYRALRTPEVDAGLRIWSVLLKAAGLTAALALAFQLVPWLLPLVTGAGDILAADPEVLPVGAVLLVGAWVALGALFGFRGIKTRRWLYAWLGLLFFALAFTELLPAINASTDSFWLVGPNALRLFGILCAVVGATRELVLAYQQQQLRLMESVESERTKEARLQAEQRAMEELAHEARNALTSIEGATKTLERYRDRLDDDTRAGLTEAISGEIRRLQQLVSPERVRSTAGEFRLVDVVTAVVTAARSHGVTVDVDVPEALSAYGQPAETGQVVQNLVENARRYAPGSPIHIRAKATPDGAVLRVEDEGPGVPRDERTAIFERGHRGTTARTEDGTGLGLYVSARLMHEQGGDLWVDDRPGGGASFALWLPAAGPSAELVEQVGDEVEHAVQGAQVTPLFRARPAQDADVGATRSVRKHDDHVGQHVGG